MPNTPENDDTDLWENRQLGASEKHARRVSPDRERAVDDALGLQPITIRLQKELVDELKELAKSEGIGYQPYVRQILTRFVRDRRKKLKTT
jgi:hypothetical protein